MQRVWNTQIENLQLGIERAYRSVESLLRGNERNSAVIENESACNENLHLHIVKLGIQKTPSSFRLQSLSRLLGVFCVSYYTRCTLPDFSARAETHTRFGLPSTRIRTF